MRCARTTLTAALTTGAVLLAAAGAQAATKTVAAGPPLTAPPKGVPQDADTNQFFRKTVTIHVGDSVRWRFFGFHTVDIPKKGDAPPQLAMADPANLVSGVNDQAGQPFWFNGLPRVIFTPSVLSPTGGKTYNGNKLVTAGLPLSEGPPKPFKVKFTKRGVYKYYCSIHLGSADMQGTVKVLPKRAHVPSAKQDRRAVRRQLAAVIKQLKKDDKKAPPAGNVVSAGVDSKISTLFRFSPAQKTVKVGDVVTFRMSSKTAEVHTATFGTPDSFLMSLAERGIGPQPPDNAFGFNPMLVYPSDNPATAGVLVHSAGVHGNGFVNTGAMDREAATPSPASMRVRFTQAGTFNYICLIHPNMKGTITVQQ